MKNIYQKLAFSILGILATFSLSAQTACASASNIYTFTYNGATYEVVRENKSWTAAATCAVERGGYLAEINDLAEQDAVYNEVLSNAGITASNTVAPDGGGASYVWFGGNDLGVEGEWTWDGNNDGTGTQFWQGTSSGSPVGGLFNNWGNEPDDFGSGQDGLGLAISDWPLGVSGQWNDVSDANTLYYVIEYPSTVGIIFQPYKNIAIFPIPSSKEVTINAEIGMNSIIVYTLKGAVVESIELDSKVNYILDIENYDKGAYILRIILENGEEQARKIVR